MPSLKARLTLWLLRNRHLLRGRLRPEVVDGRFDIPAFRARTERMVARMKLPDGVRFEPVSVDGMAGEWISPEGAPDDAVLLYVHGGGFISGGRATHRGHVAKFARGSGLAALLFDYRLAPEHPFPAALQDTYRAYLWLLDQGFAPERIVLGGESAGGSLVLALLLALKRAGLPQPGGAFAISPAADMACTAVSFYTNLARDIAPPGAPQHWCALYAGGADMADPLLSPLHGDFSGVAPLYIVVGEAEVHRDDAVALGERARAQGATVTLDVADDMVHAFPLLAPMFAEATRAFSDICAFARAAVALGAQGPSAD